MIAMKVLGLKEENKMHRAMVKAVEDAILSAGEYLGSLVYQGGKTNPSVFVLELDIYEEETDEKDINSLDIKSLRGEDISRRNFSDGIIDVYVHSKAPPS